MKPTPTPNVSSTSIEASRPPRWGWMAALLFALLLPRPAFAQNNGAVIPFEPLQFFNASGAIASGAKLCSFAAGTTTPLATYSEQTLTTANSNPITLSATGAASSRIYTQAASYKFILYAALAGAPNVCPYSGTVIWSRDNQYDFGQLIAAGLVTVTSLNNRQYCVTGANFGAKFTAAAALLPSTGGIVDCSNLQGAQTIASDVFTGQTKPLLVIWPTGTASSAVSLTIPSTMTLDFPEGGILSMASGTTATVNGEVRGTLSQHFAGSGSVTLNGNAVQFPEWSTGAFDGRVGFGGNQDPQSKIGISGNWTGPIDSNALSILTHITATTGNHDNAGMISQPILTPPSSGVTGYLAGVTVWPSFTTNGGTANRYAGYYHRNIDIPTGFLTPFDGSNGMAYGAFIQAPTINGSASDQAYGIGTTGKVGLVGDAPINFEPTVAAPTVRIARAVSNGSYISDSKTGDLTLDALGQAFLFSTKTNGQVANVVITSTGVVEFSNFTGANGTPAFVFEPNGFGNVGSFAIGASTTSGISPFMVSMTATVTTANTDFYRAWINNTGAITIPAGTAARVSTLTLEEPNISAVGTVSDAYTLIIKNNPTEGTRNGSLWVENGLARFSGGILINSTAQVGTAITSSGTVVMTSITSSATGDYMCYDTATGSVMQNPATCTLSTERAKHDISYSQIPGLDLVMALQPISFVSNNHPEMGTQFGFKAEDVDRIEKRLVYYDGEKRPNGFAYENYTAILTQAMKEQQAQIDQMRNRIDQLEQR